MNWIAEWRRRWRTGAVVAVIGLGLPHCAPVRPYQMPESPEIQDTAFIAVENPRIRTGEPVAKWWTEFEDADLLRLIDRSMAHNHDVRQALARVREARALSRASGFDRYPTATSNLSATRERASKESLTGDFFDPEYSSYSLGLSASWELDLFGRVSQGIAAAEAGEGFSNADLADTQVVVAGEVGMAYMGLRGAQYRLDVARRNVANQQQTYDMIRDLAEGGRSSDLDVVRAEALLSQTRAAMAPLEAEIDRNLNRLAVLTGQAPAALREDLSQVRPLPSLPASVDVGDPASLLRRRPDIRRAERGLARVSAQYNLEATDIFPRVSILGSLGFLATNFSNLLSSDAVTYSIGPSIDWAAFDLGRQRAEAEAADARVEGALAAYEQTVLLALEDVDTALSAFAREEQRRQELQVAARASARAVELARLRFDAGLDSFLDFLDAERTLLNAEQALAESEVGVATRLVTVYKALGGGWNIAPEDATGEGAATPGE